MQSLDRKFWRLVVETIPECTQNPFLFDPDLYPQRRTKETRLFFNVENDWEFSKLAEATAKQVCARCDIQKQCLEYALKYKEPSMIYGGMTPIERAKLLGLTQL